MEGRVIGRGALAGLIAGVLGFIYAFIFAEPVIDKAIDYEGGRGEVLEAIAQTLGQAAEPEGPEIYNRTFQSTIGIATGIIGISVAFGLLIAVAFIILHARFNVRPRVLVWSIAAFGFLGFFMLPFAKYPANPPAIGHDFTIQTRGILYLTMVALSMVLLGVAVVVARRLAARSGWMRAVVYSTLGFLVVFGIVLLVMPSLGDLSANVAMSNEFGFARALTETPQPIVNILNEAITVDGITYAPGQIMYQGFDADMLWQFRWFSVINQLLIWGVIALVLGALLDKLLLPRTPDAVATAAPEPAGV